MGFSRKSRDWFKGSSRRGCGGAGGGRGRSASFPGTVGRDGIGADLRSVSGEAVGGGCPIPMSLGWEVGGRAGGCRESMRVGVGQSIPRGRGQRDMEKSDV